MEYKKEHFVGENRRKRLGAFPGVIRDVKKQSSGNLVITLVRKKKGREITIQAIFKHFEVIAYNLADVLREGRKIIAYGIISKNKTLFPVCFVEYKNEGKMVRREIEENKLEYKAILEHHPVPEQSRLF